MESSTKTSLEKVLQQKLSCYGRFKMRIDLQNRREAVLLTKRYVKKNAVGMLFQK